MKVYAIIEIDLYEQASMRDVIPIVQTAAQDFAGAVHIIGRAKLTRIKTAKPSDPSDEGQSMPDV